MNDILAVIIGVLVGVIAAIPMSLVIVAGMRQPSWRRPDVMDARWECTDSSSVIVIDLPQTEEV